MFKNQAPKVTDQGSRIEVRLKVKDQGRSRVNARVTRKGQGSRVKGHEERKGHVEGSKVKVSALDWQLLTCWSSTLVPILKVVMHC